VGVDVKVDIKVIRSKVMGLILTLGTAQRLLLVNTEKKLLVP
jgi:hypothetical protein